jgi:hypothetical protein
MMMNNLFDFYSSKDKPKEETKDYIDEDAKYTVANINPFDFVNSINTNKKDLISTADDPKVAEANYNPWLINKALSYFEDTVLQANEMNTNYQLDNVLQYRYLINIVRPRKRFSQWVKKDKSGDIEVLKEVYGYSQRKAEVALSLLSTDQVEELRKRTRKGGLKK